MLGGSLAHLLKQGILGRAKGISEILTGRVEASQQGGKAVVRDLDPSAKRRVQVSRCLLLGTGKNLGGLDRNSAFMVR